MSPFVSSLVAANKKIMKINVEVFIKARQRIRKKCASLISHDIIIMYTCGLEIESSKSKDEKKILTDYLCPTLENVTYELHAYATRLCNMNMLVHNI